MTQERSETATTRPIDWNRVGSPSCDTGAQTEALRAMGLDAQARPINGSAPDFSQIVNVMPQLLTRDANGQSIWNGQLIDIAALTTIMENGERRDRFDGMHCDGAVNTVEIQATVIAMAQLARLRVVANKSHTAGAGPIVVTNEEIIAAMQSLTPDEIRPAAEAAFCKIMGISPAVCEIDRSSVPFAFDRSNSLTPPR